MTSMTSGSTDIGRRWKLPVLGGVLVGLSYLPGPFLPLNLVGFFPLLLWLETRDGSLPYERLKVGFVFGTVVHLISMHFMYSMLVHSWLVVLLYLGVAAALGVSISM